MRSVLALWRVRDDMLQTLQPVRADVIGCSTMMRLVCNYYHLSPHIRAHVLCTPPPRTRYVFLSTELGEDAARIAVMAQALNEARPSKHIWVQ